MSVVGGPSVAVAVPWLDDALTELRESGPLAEAAPTLDWLLRHAFSTAPDTPDWRAWLLGQFEGARELLHSHAPGPTRCGVALQHSRDQRHALELAVENAQLASWACAQPVSLATGIDHLWLDPAPTPALTAQDTVAIVGTLDTALRERGWSLSALDAQRWLVGSRERVECDTWTPLEAAGRAIRTHLPEGRDARLVRAVMNEMQMILHEHPVNQHRSNNGQPPVNGVWLWGFGALCAAAGRTLPPLSADDDWLRELWQLHGNEIAATATDALARGADARTALIAVSNPPGDTSAERVRHCEATIFAACRRALTSGDVVLRFNSGASVHTLDRSPGRTWRRWLRWPGSRT